MTATKATKAPIYLSEPGNGGCYALKVAYNHLLKVSFRSHLIISALLRLSLICYGQIHDAHSAVRYTDIDYQVVTDGARLVLGGGTPFARHTYRYSPMLAYLQIPNLMLHPACGKVIFATFDLLLAVLIYELVRLELEMQGRKSIDRLFSSFGKSQKQLGFCDSLDAKLSPEKIACASAIFWLYNPLTAVISTRGSGDSFSSFFVILSVYLLKKAEHTPTKSKWLVFGAGLAHGVAIHLRLYPLLFSLAYYLALSTSLVGNIRDLLGQVLVPNKQQFCLVLGTLLSLIALTWTFYWMYGWQYIFEAYLYHFVRKDVRHNFSLHFLQQYLSSATNVEESTAIVKFFILAPQFLLIFYLSLSFGQFRQTLPFCVFTLAFVIVTYNSVVTSQYFIWYLAVLPLCLHNLGTLSLQRCTFLMTLWLGGQGMWLMPAYLLEFETLHTYYWIGLQSAVFFIINGYILVQLINNYGFTTTRGRRMLYCK
ncbi:GPI mannosyltransferase 1 [Scaptodrosophila lebanonensis]|uniref:GPI alpha-1,4-mannosyltransferase I, catalytic subunit n=1 Tax=Drosophila lebanonensis TaxID=7225 RepID=A0A6J2TAK3_DROLE|nr:GPI mannosyltransferase 1 [Scaptodrosophila lebanonensis]